MTEHSSYEYTSLALSPPSILLSAAEYTDGLMPANAMVEPNGGVFWPVPTKLQVNITNKIQVKINLATLTDKQYELLFPYKI